MKRTTTKKSAKKSTKKQKLDSSTFILELVITIGVAAVLAAVLLVAAGFVIANVDSLATNVDAYSSVAHVSSIVFGLIVGYRLNTLFQLHR